MSDSNATEVTVGLTVFKAMGPELIERVASGRLHRVVLTKHGHPVAALVALEDEPAELWEALADLMAPVEGVDLTAPTGESWAAG